MAPKILHRFEWFKLWLKTDRLKYFRDFSRLSYDGITKWPKKGLKHWSNHRRLLARNNKENEIFHKRDISSAHLLPWDLKSFDLLFIAIDKSETPIAHSSVCGGSLRFDQCFRPFFILQPLKFCNVEFLYTSSDIRRQKKKKIQWSFNF